MIPNSKAQDAVGDTFTRAFQERGQVGCQHTAPRGDTPHFNSRYSTTSKVSV